MLVPSNALKGFLEKATATYYETLKGSPGAEYLKGRGLSGASAQSFRIGIVENPLPGHEQYRGMLAIPYLTRSGVVSMRFRRIDEGEPKYLGLPGDTLRLFNPEALMKPGPHVCIAEGEFDAMIATQCGFPTVGLPGVASWKSTMARCFAGYDAVYVLADNDDKGQGLAFAEKIAESVENARIVLMPKGHDVNSLYLEGGEEALRGLMRIEDL